MTFTSKVYPACLANYDPEEVSGAMATVSGWGTTAYEGSVSDTLQKVLVPVLSKSNCVDTYGTNIKSSMFCAGEKGKDSCQGDSGGKIW